MDLIKTIILKSDMRCNLRCRYCYEFNRNGTSYNKNRITIEQLCAFIERVAEMFPGSRILWMLHGGEPLINGLEYFLGFANCIRKVNADYDVEFKIALQTNATLLTHKWIQALEDNSDLLSERIISVSIDGPKNINDEVRRTTSGESSYRMTVDAIDLIKKSKLFFTTISVVGEHNVDKPDEVYRYIKSLNSNLCKFIPCFNYNNLGETELYGITPVQYAEFMCRIFDLWMHDLPYTKNKNWFVIDPIATIISKISDIFVTWCEYRKEKCDNFTSLYPDGELWLCDTYNHDTMRDKAFVGNIFNMSDRELRMALETPCDVCGYDAFYNEITSRCGKCDIYEYCCGGCIPSRLDMKNKSKALFDEYCAAKHLLINHIKEGVFLALS